MKLIYLAAPYSHPDEQVRKDRVEAINWFAAMLHCVPEVELKHGPISVFSPISQAGAWLEHFPVNFEHSNGYWLPRDLAILKHCAELWILPLPGWGVSEGVELEWKAATSLQMPVRYLQSKSSMFNCERLNLDQEEIVWTL